MRKLSPLWRILAICAVLLLALLIVVHVYLADWLLKYANRELSNIPGYQGSIESINIDLYRGAYRINHLVLNKKNGNIPTPFVAIGTVDLSLQWSALFHGRIVSSITLIRPTINFAVKEDAVQNGAGVDWSKKIKDLMPIDINYVRFREGNITFQNFSSTPQVNIFIHHMSGEVSNLRNVVDAGQPLPSTIDIKGDTIGDGSMAIHGRMNILKDVPDMNLLLALENANLPAINNFSEAYAAFDFKSGNFSLYSQLVVKNGQVSGYVKPIASHLSVDILKKANPVQIAWDTFVASVLKIFTNPSHDQFATRVDLQGTLNDVSPDVWSTLGGIVRNAFVSAMTKGFDETGNQDLGKP